VQDHQQRGTDDGDELQGPESCRRNREHSVVANVTAARLSCVAGELGGLVVPHLLSHHHEDQQPEDEDQGEPDPTQHRGVLGHPTDEAPQGSPVHLSGWGVVGFGHGEWGHVLTDIAGVPCVFRKAEGSGLIWSQSVLKPNQHPC
uniref:Uncharacterized protein n=1 Tax=Paramormyrops kingsleyae TaxID=1676925 RepID=A0A3B3QUI0_9TELE